MTGEQITLALTAISAIAAAVAAIANWRSLGTTRSAAEVAALTGVAETYESDNMRKALRTLAYLVPMPYDEAVVQQWANTWKAEMDKANGRAEWASELDLARRRVSGYFLWLNRLHSGKMVSDEFLTPIRK